MSALSALYCPALETDTVHVWLASPAVAAAHAAGRHGLLRRWLAGYSRLAPERLQFDRLGQGKPRLVPGTGLEFSVSSSRGWVLAAFARGTPLGIDLETSRPGAFAPALVRAHFSAPEQAALEALGPQERDLEFLRLWTQREAVLKLCGLGLLGLPSLRQGAARQRIWCEELKLGQGLVGALALLHAPSSFEVFQEEVGDESGRAWG